MLVVGLSVQLQKPFLNFLKQLECIFIQPLKLYNMLLKQKQDVQSKAWSVQCIVHDPVKNMFYNKCNHTLS